MGAKVYSVERQNELFKQTSILLPKLGIRPKHLLWDGYKGLPSYAPLIVLSLLQGTVYSTTFMAQLK
jgi:protein-L-isoaspartate(D-aspartate) O-methyltransferase